MAVRPARSGTRSLRFRFRLYAFGIAVILAIAGCSTTSEDSSSSSQPVMGGTLVAAISGDPQNLDMALNSNALAIIPGSNIFETLFTINDSYTPTPMLAESYERSTDGLTYTIKIRKGVQFHDGEMMTAQDVVASLERWELVSGTGKLAAKAITSISAADDSTVVVSLSTPRYSFIADLAATTQAAIIVPAKVATSAGKNPIPDDQIIGTGPYKLEKYNHGTSIELTRFDKYSSRTEAPNGLSGKKKAYLDKIDLRFVPDPSQQLNGVKSGEFQWAQSVSPDEYDALKDSPTIHASVSNSGLVPTILINHASSSAFSDVKAREALNMLIDKKAMATASFGPKPFWDPLSGSFVYKIDKPLYSEAGNAVYSKYDTKAAAELLKEAGVANKTIRIYTSQTYGYMYQMAVVLQSQLKAVGLESDVQVFDFPSMLSKLTTDPNDWDISISAYNGTVTSPDQILPLTPNRPGAFHSDELDALLAKYNSSTTPKQAKTAVDEITQFAWKQFPVITVGPLHNFDVYSKKLVKSDFIPYIFWNAYLIG